MFCPDMGIAERIENMDAFQARPDVLVELQLKKCRISIGMALESYSPGLENHSSSGVPYVIYGDHMWIYLGFTPCESVRNLLKEEYGAVFGKIEPVEQSGNQDVNKRDLGFAFGTPFVGIPLPR